MEFSDIWGYVVAVISAGGITQLINWRINKRKANAETQSSEVEVIAQAMRDVYEPLVDRQQKEIDRQSDKIHNLEQQIEEMKEKHEAEIKTMKEENEKMQEEFENRIVTLTKLIQSNSNYPARGANGQFIKTNP